MTDSPAQQRINQRRGEIITRYLALWARMIDEWRTASHEDQAWLMYSANYLLRTAGVPWAIDPFTLQSRLPDAPTVHAAHDLSGLLFVLLTHSHADHLDIPLIHALRDAPIQWVVPEALLPIVIGDAGLPIERIILPQPGIALTLHGINILPFDGLHWEHTPQGLKGVPAMGYCVAFNKKRWLFPGDTRTYDAHQLPSFGALDGLFAHVWLGRSSALLDKPPLLEAFCHFCLNLNPRRVVVTHLEEFGRTPDNYWTVAHFHQVKVRFQEITRPSDVSHALLGDGVFL